MMPQPGIKTLVNDGKGKPEPAENPLLNHVVLRKILSLNVLTFTDLKNFRLVSTFWYHTSLDLWYKTAVIKLVPNTKTRIGISTADLESRYANNTFLTRLGPRPYSMYKVKNWQPKFDAVKSEIIEADFSFGDVVAPQVEYLHIDQCNFTRPEKFEEIVLSCLNLKELVLSGNGYVARTREYDPVIPVEKQLVHLKNVTIDGLMTLGWEQFLFHAPNVETLIYKQNKAYSQHSFSSFLHALTQLQCRHKFNWPIKNLNLSEASGTYTDLVTLRYHEFPLENLTIQFEKYQTDTWFRPILHGSAKTLKVLNVIRVSDKVDPPTHIPMDFPCGAQLDHLTELYFWGSVVDNLDFLRFTPRLKIVEMNRSGFEKRKLMVYSKLPVDQVEPYDENVDVVQRTVGCWNNLANQPVMLMDCLVRLMLDFKLGVGSLYTLRRWLPNLKEFGMVFQHQTFQLACEEWPKLEEMVVMYGSLVTDDVVAGQHFMSLKCLKKFKLDAYCNQGWLADKSVFDGFLKLPELRSLFICVSKQMSVDAALALEKKMVNVKIIRNYGNGPHSDYDCCQRVAFNKERKLMYKPSS